MGFDDERDTTKYAGFKVRWDKDANTFVFESKEERDRWQIHHYGHVRNAWTEPEEQTDERMPIVYKHVSFEPGEDVIWERAVKACPLSQYGSLDVFRYLGEVAKLALSMDTAPKLRAMPKRGML